MIRVQTILLAILLTCITCAVLFGCAPTRDRSPLIEAMHRDGLLVFEDGSPQPAPRPATPGGAELSDSGELTLVQLVAAVDAFNPRLAAARAQIGHAGADAWQATLRPNPSIEIETENVRPGNRGFGVSETTLGFAQPIRSVARTSTARARGTSRIEASKQSYERLRREVRSAAVREALQMMYFQRTLAIHDEMLAIARRSSNIAQARFEARAAPESESIRARIEVDELELSVNGLRGELAAAEARLAALLGGRRVEVHRLTPLSQPAGDEAWTGETALVQRALSNHPAMHEAHAAVEAASREIAWQRARSRPDLIARVGVGVDHAADESFVEAGLSIPLPIVDENQGAVLASRFELIRAQRSLEAVQADLEASVTESLHRLNSASAQLAVFDDRIMTGANAAHTQAIAGYQAGRLPFVDLLDAQRTLIDANLKRIELMHTRNLAWAELAALLGEAPFHTQTQEQNP